MSVLKPKIESVINGLLSISLDSVTVVESIFNSIIVQRATSVGGTYSQIAIVPLEGLSSYSYLDTVSAPNLYYKARFFHTSTLVLSVESDPAQETGNFSEYVTPASTAAPSYPPEIALSEQDREIVESIRITMGDLGLIERDVYNSSAPGTNCGVQLSSDIMTWELINFKGWPQSIVVDGEVKTSLQDPLVIGYRYLTFTGTIDNSLDVFYRTFRFADREILLAYDRARNLLVSCGLKSEQVTTEMLIMQAAILLLEGELRDTQSTGISIRDGDTSFDNSFLIRSRTEDLSDLKRKMQYIIECALANASYNLEGVRID